MRQPKNHVEVDETWVGGRTRGEGRGVHHKVPVSCAIEVRHRKPGTKLDNRKDGRYAGRVRLAVVLDRSAESLCGFVESTVAPGSLIVTDDWSGYAGLGKRGYEHFAVADVLVAVTPSRPAAGLVQGRLDARISRTMSSPDPEPASSPSRLYLAPIGSPRPCRPCTRTGRPALGGLRRVLVPARYDQSIWFSPT